MSDQELEPDDASSSQTQCYEEAFIDYEKQHRTTHPALSFMLQKGLKSFWYIYVMMTTTLALHFAFYTYQGSRSGVLGILDQKKPSLGVAEDSTGLIPQFSTIPVMFWNSSEYSYIEAASEKADIAVQKAWMQLQPESSSHIKIDERSSPSSPTPLHDPETGDDYLGIAVFHQLHCLHAVARGFSLLYRGEPLEDTLSHTQHCIEYLRISMMCHADTALEGGEFVDSMHVAQGMGTVHTCKNWDEVLSWTNEHALPK